MVAVATTTGRMIAVRLEAGEDVGIALLREVDRTGAGGAAVVAAIGSLGSLEYAVIGTAEDGTACYEKRMVQTPLEIASLQGHIGRRADGEAAFHLHGVFALGDGSVVAGHMFAARVLLTFEATIVLGEGLTWGAEPFRPPGAVHDPGMTVFVPRVES
jgi:predicted DNA-binding protein with PD1-like motif